MTDACESLKRSLTKEIADIKKSEAPSQNQQSMIAIAMESLNNLNKHSTAWMAFWNALPSPTTKDILNSIKSAEDDYSKAETLEKEMQDLAAARAKAERDIIAVENLFFLFFQTRFLAHRLLANVCL